MLSTQLYISEQYLYYLIWRYTVKIKKCFIKICKNRKQWRHRIRNWERLFFLLEQLIFVQIFDYLWPRTSIFLIQTFRSAGGSTVPICSNIYALGIYSALCPVSNFCLHPVMWTRNDFVRTRIRILIPRSTLILIPYHKTMPCNCCYLTTKISKCT